MIYEPTIITPKQRYNLYLFGSIYDPGTIIHYPFNKSVGIGASETVILAWDGAAHPSPTEGGRMNDRDLTPAPPPREKGTSLRLDTIRSER